MRRILLFLILICSFASRVPAQISVRSIGNATQPVGVRGFVAEIDLTHPKLSVVIGPAAPAKVAVGADPQVNALLVPADQWAKNNNLSCAVNANYFGWKPGGGRMVGLVVNNGVTLSPMRSWKGSVDPALVFSNDGKGLLGRIIGPGQPHVDIADIRYAVAGVGGSESDNVPGSLLIQAGKNLGATARVSHGRCVARTAAGLDQSGHHLYLVVVDCVPNWSKGMTLPELADLMIGLGVHDAINLDGGGSASFVYRLNPADSYSTNRPCDESGNGRPGQFRPVAVQLGFGINTASVSPQSASKK